MKLYIIFKKKALITLFLITSIEINNTVNMESSELCIVYIVESASITMNRKNNDGHVT